MQKYDYIQHLKVIVNQLHSNDIVKFFNEAMIPQNNGLYSNFEFGKLIPILFFQKETI